MSVGLYLDVHVPAAITREVFDRPCELEEQDLLKGSEPSAAEKALLDRELEDYGESPDIGAAWVEVEARLRQPPTTC